jgi:di/tricarboxylate transporter
VRPERRLLIVLALLGAAIVMFSLNRPRADAVALLMMVALPFTGLISVNEAIAGLADPNLVLIAAMFVIGEALARTGVAQGLGDWLVRRGGQPAGARAIGGVCNGAVTLHRHSGRFGG